MAFLLFKYFLIKLYEFFKLHCGLFLFLNSPFTTTIFFSFFSMAMSIISCFNVTSFDNSKIAPYKSFTHLLILFSFLLWSLFTRINRLHSDSLSKINFSMHITISRSVSSDSWILVQFICSCINPRWSIQYFRHASRRIST